MKKLFAIVVLLMSAFVANSQVLDAPQPAGNSGSHSFSSVYLIYSPAKYYGQNSDSDPFMKFAIGGDNASLLPIDNFTAYFTKGLMAEWYHKTEDKLSTNMFSVKAPLNVMFDLKLSNQMSVLPFAGVNASLGIIARIEDSSSHYNLYSKDDMGDYAFRRFLVGWQIGTRINYKGFYGMVSFEKSFMDAGKNLDSKLGGVNIGIGKYL